MAELTLEQQRALAIAQAKRKRAEAESQQLEQLEQTMRTTSAYGPVEIGFEGYADPLMQITGLGATVFEEGLIMLNDALGNDRYVAELNARKDALGMPSQIIDRFRSEIRDTLAIPDPTVRADVAKKKTAEYNKALTYYGIAQPLLNIIPGLRIANRLVVDEIKRKPALFAAGEVTGIISETEAAMRGAGPMTQALVGGISSAFSPFTYNTVVQGIQKVSDPKLIKQYGQANFTKASEFLQNMATKSPEEISENIARQQIEGAPLEVLTGDEGFTFLEQALSKEVQSLQLGKRDREYQAKLSKIFGDRKNVKSTADFLRAEQARHQLSLDALTELNTKKALSELEAVRPDATAEEISQEVFNSLNKSFEQGRQLEDEMWAAVELSKSAFKYNNARKAYDNLIQQLGDVRAEDMPDIAKKFLSESGKLKTVNDLYGLYSKLGELSVSSRAAKEFNTARIATQLREAIFEDLSKIEGTGAAISRAKDVSRIVNQKFNKGVVGRILSYSREGGEAIDPTLTLQKTVKAGQEGKLSVDQLAQAIKRIGADDMTPKTQEDLAVLHNLQDYLRTKFVQKSVKTGTEEIDPTKAQAFIDQNKQILDIPEFAPLKAQLESAKDATDALRSEVKDLKDLYAHRYGTKGEKAFSRFINSGSSNRMRSILAGGNPVGDMRDLLNLVNRSPINSFKQAGVNKKDVVQGVKDSIYDYIVSIGTKSSDFELSTVDNLVKNPEIREALELALSPKEMKNIELFTQQVKKFNDYKSTAIKTQEIGKQNFLINALALASGVLVGKAVPGPASLAAVSAGKRTATDVLLKLQKGEVVDILSDAMQDPKLFDALLMNPVTYNRKGLVRKRTYLNKYLASRGITAGLEKVDEGRMQEAREANQNASSKVLEFLNPFSETRVSTTPGLGRIQDLMK
jgi:hypothetical protein